MMKKEGKDALKYLIDNNEKENQLVLHRIFLMIQKLYKKNRISLPEASDIICSSLFKIPSDTDPFLLSSKVLNCLEILIKDFQYFFPNPYTNLSHPFSSHLFFLSFFF
jgi:hypothetical protein